MNRIRDLRKEANMKQQDLADLLSVGRTAISNYEIESRQLDPDTIRQLCAIFRCTSDYLLCLSSRREPEISDEDADLLAAYKRAPDSIRAGIDTLLEPYKAKKEAEGL